MLALKVSYREEIGVFVPFGDPDRKPKKTSAVTATIRYGTETHP